MEESISNALLVMVVGMTTVFLILWLVVLIGNSLIRITNKFWSAIEIKNDNGDDSPNPHSDGTVAAIVAAVGMVTNGQGTITKIEKVKS